MDYLTILFWSNRKIIPYSHILYYLTFLIRLAITIIVVYFTLSDWMNKNWFQTFLSFFRQQSILENST